MGAKMVKLECVDECAASSLNERLVKALTERDQWKALATKFADACEIDGFGDVRRANMSALTQTFAEFDRINNV
jgi:hypothetical protein